VLYALLQFYLEACVGNSKAARKHQCTKLYGCFLQRGSLQSVTKHANRLPEKELAVHSVVTPHSFLDDWDRSALSRIASIFEATNRAPDRTNCVSDTVLHEAEEKDVTTLKRKK